uniref:Bestrophin homolog n=1 Tax=Acrobeloides nanus TaxID=290746 RepID=A0A914CSZ9_9BILA
MFEVLSKQKDKKPYRLVCISIVSWDGETDSTKEIGSVWKSIIHELAAWTIVYYIVFVVYRVLLDNDKQKVFAAFAQDCNERLDYIPLTFMLGFFVTIVVDRWKNIFANIGFIDNVAFYIASYIRGHDEESKIVRRNIMRYLCLTQILVLRDISLPVRKRFPNLEAVIDAGFLQPHEKRMLDNISNDFTKYWVPINWVFNLCYEMRAKNKVLNDVLLNGMLLEVKNYRSELQTLCNTDWVPVPLAYPQVVFLAVRVYFLICVVSRQYIITDNVENKSLIDLYIPFMTMLQLVFYMGWLKVAEALLNPLGDDDDDFECNYIIDRNITISLLMADQCNDEMPIQMPDLFRTGETPLYSEEAAKMPVKPLIGSAALSSIDEEEKVLMVPHPSSRNPTPDGSPQMRQRFTDKLEAELNREIPMSLQNATLESGRTNFLDVPRRLWNNAFTKKQRSNSQHNLEKVDVEETDVSNSKTIG